MKFSATIIWTGLYEYDGHRGRKCMDYTQVVVESISFSKTLFVNI
jgi:hypothetical protein